MCYYKKKSKKIYKYEGQEYISKIIVRDTTRLELELKDITIYEDEKIPDYKKFIKKVSDTSGEPETNLKTEISAGKIGTQEITIEAIDKNGNKTEKTATLTIKIDNEGPVISGLGDKTVAKNSSIDYLSGVKAIDTNQQIHFQQNENLQVIILIANAMNI